MPKYTFRNYHAHLGLAGRETCIVPEEVAADQEAFDGRTFPVLVWWAPERVDAYGNRVDATYRVRRVRLVGDDYGLHTSGTGDMIVRPLTGPFGPPRTIDGHNTHGRYTASKYGRGV